MSYNQFLEFFRHFSKNPTNPLIDNPLVRVYTSDRYGEKKYSVFGYDAGLTKGFNLLW